MRQVTEQAVQAFFSGRARRCGNTVVSTDGEYVYMHLHGNMIAKRHSASGKVRVTLAGWGTPTTRERVNGVLSRIDGAGYFHQQDFCQMYNGKEVDDDAWITVREGF